MARPVTPVQSFTTSTAQECSL